MFFNFHLVETSVSDRKVWRMDSADDYGYREIAAHYEFFKEGVKKKERTKDFSVLEVTSEVLDSSKFRNGIITVESKAVAATSLVLSDFAGLEPEESDEAKKDENEKCLEFMKNIKDEKWNLPYPPLEITVRPLIYVVYFRMKYTKDETWTRLRNEMRRIVCGISLAFLKEWQECKS